MRSRRMRWLGLPLVLSLAAVGAPTVAPTVASCSAPQTPPAPRAGASRRGLGGAGVVEIAISAPAEYRGAAQPRSIAEGEAADLLVVAKDPHEHLLSLCEPVAVCAAGERLGD